MVSEQSAQDHGGESGGEMSTVTKYYVEILMRVGEDDSDEISRICPYDSERMAEKAERGVHINLNHELYWTQISTTKHEWCKGCGALDKNAPGESACDDCMMDLGNEWEND